MATFTGSNDAEIIPDLIIGPVQGIGNDFVDALGADDIAIGWSGDDVIRGGAGGDVIIGGMLNAAGVITPAGIDAADYTTSLDGVTIDLSVTLNLTLPMLGVNLKLIGASQGFGGDAQGDYLVDIVNLIGSNTGGDNLSGNAAANTMNGQGGNDTLYGHGGNDILLGGAGDDVLVGGAGADSLQGGAGTNDTADYSGSLAPVTVNLTSNTGSGGDAQGDALTGIERLIGSAGNDSLTGSAGNDTLIGGAGADVLVGAGGADTVDYSTSGLAVIIDLQNGIADGGDATGDNLTGIENVIGSEYDDRLTGTGAEANRLEGGAGDDLLDGLAGDDTMIGGVGRDIYYVDSAADQTVELADEGIDTVRSYLDWVLTDNVDRLELLASASNGTGNALNNTLVGNNNINVFDGGAGDDYLTAGNGNDTLYGGDGGDRLVGGAGVDILFAGAGNDFFRYEAVTDSLVGPGNRDTLMDFTHGEDKISLQALRADAGNQAFSFIGTAAFSGEAGELRYRAYGNTCLVDADVNGDQVSDFQVAVAGTDFMASSDFIV